MEKYYPIIFVGLLFIILVGGGVLSRITRQKAAERGAERASQKHQVRREAFKPQQVTVMDVITVELPADRVRHIITDTKVVKPQEDGTWTARSAFSKEVPFMVGIESGGPQTKVAVRQFLSKNDVHDGDIFWTTIAGKLHKEAEKTGAAFSYEPDTAFQVHEIKEGLFRYQR